MNIFISKNNQCLLASRLHLHGNVCKILSNKSKFRLLVLQKQVQVQAVEYKDSYRIYKSLEYCTTGSPAYKSGRWMPAYDSLHEKELSLDAELRRLHCDL